MTTTTTTTGQVFDNCCDGSLHDGNNDDDEDDADDAVDGTSCNKRWGHLRRTERHGDDEPRQQHGVWTTNTFLGINVPRQSGPGRQGHCDHKD